MTCVLRWADEPSEQGALAKIVRRDGAYYVEATGTNLTLIVGPLGDEVEANQTRDRVNNSIRNATDFLRGTHYDMPSVALY